MNRLLILKQARDRLEMGKKEAQAQEEKFRNEIREVEAYRLQQVAEERYLRAFAGGREVFEGICRGSW